MSRKVNRDTDAQYDYIRANYRRVYVRAKDQRSLKQIAERFEVSVVDLVTALTKTPDHVIGMSILANLGDKK